MNINFVLGLPHSGKTTFVRSTWPQARVVDVVDYQNVLQLREGGRKRVALRRMAYDIGRIIKKREDELLVVEFPGISPAERKIVKDILFSFMKSDDVLQVYWITTDAQDIRTRVENENVSWEEIKVQMKWCSTPSAEEGYPVVFTVHNVGATSADLQIVEQARYHLDYQGTDAAEASKLLSEWAEGKIDTLNRRH